MNDSIVTVDTKIESNTLDIIRTETALSRYPIHRLSNKGIINIEIRRKDEKGGNVLFWEVSHNSRYGQPGPLAYKLDTLIINRKIDEAGRPVPKVLKLGSLREVAEELDLGGDTSILKRALRQNASAFITAKTVYKGADGTEHTFEFNDTRYGVVFTGEKLPNGLKADAVFLIFHDLYLKVLNTAPRRPLDYDYLRDLPPASQRFYEIVSYEMLPAFRYNQRAKLPYSEFCMYSTMTRYDNFDQVKKQMWKIHQPHVKAGYLAKVEYEATTDGEGRPDWNMFYTPGERAKSQQLVFSFAVSNTPRSRVKAVPAERKAKAQSAKLKAETITVGEQIPPLPDTSLATQTNAKASALVKKFYQLRFGQVQEPNEREVGEAAGYLSEGEDWANHLVEVGARQGKEKNQFPEMFGGLKNLISQARAPFEAKCKERKQLALKKARQSHQEAHTDAYRAFLGELLGGMLEQTVPGAFKAFTDQETSTYQFHKTRAGKSPMSARVIENYYSTEERITRLMNYINEKPNSGIPLFWQWDDMFNPTRFDPAHVSLS